MKSACTGIWMVITCAPVTIPPALAAATVMDFGPDVVQVKAQVSSRLARPLWVIKAWSVACHMKVIGKVAVTGLTIAVKACSVWTTPVVVPSTSALCGATGGRASAPWMSTFRV